MKLYIGYFISYFSLLHIVKIEYEVNLLTMLLIKEKQKFIQDVYV